MASRRRRRVAAPTLAAVVATLALVLTTATPAGTQVFGVLTIDPTEGVPGDTVNGQLDPAVIAASCAPSAAEFQAILQNDFVPIANAAFDAWEDANFPGGLPDPATDPTSFAADLYTGVLFGLFGSLELATLAWEQSFVLTFADIATQQPIGTRSSFDAATGAGQVEVPDVAPGTWAVAATCLHWNLDITADDFVTTMAAGAQWTLDNLAVPYPDFGSDEFVAAAEEAAPTLLQPASLLPGELWVELFCVLDSAGLCNPSPAPPPSTGGEMQGDAGPAAPVDAVVRFTG